MDNGLPFKGRFLFIIVMKIFFLLHESSTHHRPDFIQGFNFTGYFTFLFLPSRVEVDKERVRSLKMMTTVSPTSIKAETVDINGKVQYEK